MSLPQEPTTHRPERGFRDVLKSAGVALLAVVLLDTSVFRCGLYDYLVEVDSSVGKAVQAVHCRRSDTDQLVGVVGDSRVAEGFAVADFDRFMADSGSGLRGLNLGMPGSTLRVWALLLERIDPRRDRFRVVVVPLGHYQGRPFDGSDPAARLGDVSFTGPILSLGQAADFAGSFPDFAGQQAAWLGAVCKGFAYRYDLRALLADPASRMRGRWRLMHRHESSHGYAGRPETMTGLHREGDRLVGFPAPIPEARRRQLERFVTASARPRSVVGIAAYRTRWLGRICQRYADTATQVLIVRLPPTVLPAADGVSTELGPVLQRLAAPPNVHVVPVARTAEVQAPEFFCDTTHLNQQGRQLWTRRLAEAVAAIGN